MKKTLNFVIYPVLLGLLIVTLLYIFRVVSTQVFNSAMAALFLNLINSTAAVILYFKSVDKNNKQYYIYNLGGMVARLFFLVIMVFITIKFLNIDLVAYILIFLIFYFYMLVTELFIFIKNKK